MERKLPSPVPYSLNLMMTILYWSVAFFSVFYAVTGLSTLFKGCISRQTPNSLHMRTCNRAVARLRSPPVAVVHLPPWEHFVGGHHRILNQIHIGSLVLRKQRGSRTKKEKRQHSVTACVQEPTLLHCTHVIRARPHTIVSIMMPFLSWSMQLIYRGIIVCGSLRLPFLSPRLEMFVLFPELGEKFDHWAFFFNFCLK